MYKANGLCIKQYIFSTINQGVEGEVMASILNWCMSCICMPKKCLFIHVMLQIFLFYLKRIGKGSSTSTSWCFQWRRPGFKSPQHHCNYCIIKKPHPLSSCPCPHLDSCVWVWISFTYHQKKEKKFFGIGAII